VTAEPTRPILALPPEGVGRPAVKVAWAGVAVQALAAATALAAGAGRGPHVVVCVLLALGGLAASALAFVRAVARSRTELVDVAGLFLLLGSAPKRTRGWLWGAVATQTTLGVATAVARPYTSLAFGVLTPLWAYGLTIWWNARYGAFPPGPGAPRVHAPVR